MRSRDFKVIARDALKGNRFIAIIAGFIASFFGGLTVNTYMVSFNVTIENSEGSQGGDVTALMPLNAQGDIGYAEIWGIIGVIVFGLAALSLVYSILQLFVGSAVSIGYSQFNLDIIDGCDAKISELFSRFEQLKTAIYTKLLATLRVLLGTLLFIVPGIIMSYSYAMSNFVLAENPDMNAREALRESKRIMKGNRWRFFCLQMSFFGLALLCVLSFGIGLIWFIPYQQATFAAFYREIK